MIKRMKLGGFMLCFMLALCMLTQVSAKSESSKSLSEATNEYLWDIFYYWTWNAGFLFCAGYGFMGVSLLGDQGQTYNTCMYYIQ